jgi:hypothetical protein
MKKLLVFLSVMFLVIGTAGTALALPSTPYDDYEYYSGNLWLDEGDSAQFYFDLAFSNPTNTPLPLTNDVTGYGSVYSGFKEIESAFLHVELYSTDWNDDEKANIKFTAYYGLDWTFDLGTYYFSANGDDPYYNIDVDLSGWLLDKIQADPYGTLQVKASTYWYNDNDFAIKEAGMGVSAVPEPGTIFLMGIGLVGLAGMGRKKLFKK